MFATAVIGGLGSISGALIGVLLFRFIDTLTFLGDVPVLGNIRPLLTGGMLLVVLLVLPGGFGQLVYSVRDRYLIWVAGRRGILVPSLVADKRDTSKGAENEVGLLQGALGGGAKPVRRAARRWSTDGHLPQHRPRRRPPRRPAAAKGAADERRRPRHGQEGSNGRRHRPAKAGSGTSNGAARPTKADAPASPTPRRRASPQPPRGAARRPLKPADDADGRRPHRSHRGDGARRPGRPRRRPPGAAPSPARTDVAPILTCRGIDMAYGPVQILFDVDFDVAQGEIVALLGTNGAGKSTLLKGICGLVKPEGRHGARSRARTSPTSPPTSPPTAASR